MGYMYIVNLGTDTTNGVYMYCIHAGTRKRMVQTLCKRGQHVQLTSHPPARACPSDWWSQPVALSWTARAPEHCLSDASWNPLLSTPPFQTED